MNQPAMTTALSSLPASIEKAQHLLTAGDVIAAIHYAANLFIANPRDVSVVITVAKFLVPLRPVGCEIAQQILKAHMKIVEPEPAVLKCLIEVQESYIQDLKADRNPDQAITSLHVLLTEYLRGKKIHVDTLEWSIMGGLAIDAAMLPKIKAAGYLQEKDPIFLCGEAANMQIVKLLAREVPIAFTPHIGRDNYFSYNHAESRYSLNADRFKEALFGERYAHIFDDCFEFVHSTNGRSYYPTEKHAEIVARKERIGFNPEETSYAQDFIRHKLNLPADAWWVCLYARDAGYYHESTHDDKFFRNAPLPSFHAAIEEIIAAGGYVIRIGSQTPVKLEYQHPQVRDYASNFRDELMDLYLIAHARFLFGSPSGLTHVAFTFNTPALNVHTINCFGTWGALYIPKKPWLISEKRYLTLNEYFAKTYYQPKFFEVWENGVEQRKRFGVEYHDNTEAEITAACKEYLARAAGTYQESPEEQLLRKQFDEITQALPGPFKFKTPISTSFLAMNRYLLS
jgi:putative glycosyltransferase (TIGR04372 family)